MVTSGTITTVTTVPFTSTGATTITITGTDDLGRSPGSTVPVPAVAGS
jgi:hypothetical protein